MFVFIFSQGENRDRENGVNSFNWLKEPRFEDAEPPEAEVAFLPVEISQARDMTVLSDSTEPGTLEIDLASGHRLRITGPYDGDALARLIRGLSI